MSDGSDVDVTKQLYIMTLDDMTYAMLDDMQRAALRGAVRINAGLTSEPLFRQRVKEYIHIETLNNTPVRMATLNRRFSKAAKACGTTCVELCNRGVAAGVFEQRHVGSATLVADAMLMKQRRDGITEMYPSNEVRLAVFDFEDRFWGNAE